MIDPRLAKGLTRRLLSEAGQAADAIDEGLDGLYETIRPNRTGFTRAVRRFSRTCPLAEVSTTRDGGTYAAVVRFWEPTTATATHTYTETTLRSVTYLVSVGRNGRRLQDVPDSILVHQHAVRRLIERDHLLSDYDLKNWLDHLAPARWTAGVLVAEPNIAGRAVALPSLGGLFVGFVTAVSSNTVSWRVGAHSFYGMCELDEEQQDLHAALLGAYEREDAAAVHAAHETHGDLWVGQKPHLFRVRDELRRAS